MKILPEAVDWGSVSVCYNTGGVHVVHGPLVSDGGGEVPPLLLVDHEAHHKEESDDHDEEQSQGQRSSRRLGLGLANNTTEVGLAADDVPDSTVCRHHDGAARRRDLPDIQGLGFPFGKSER